MGARVVVVTTAEAHEPNSIKFNIDSNQVVVVVVVVVVIAYSSPARIFVQGFMNHFPPALFDSTQLN